MQVLRSSAPVCIISRAYSRPAAVALGLPNAKSRKAPFASSITGAPTRTKLFTAKSVRLRVRKSLRSKSAGTCNWSRSQIRKEKFLAKIDLWEAVGAATGSQLVEKLSTELATIKGKIQRLTAPYVEDGLSIDEFKSLKNSLVEEKVSIEQKLEGARSQTNRLEPVRNWTLEANQAYSLGFSDHYLEMSSFLKNVGSNRLLRAGTLCVEFKKPWNSLAETSVAARSADVNFAEH